MIGPPCPWPRVKQARRPRAPAAPRRDGPLALQPKTQTRPQSLPASKSNPSWHRGAGWEARGSGERWLRRATSGAGFGGRARLRRGRSWRRPAHATAFRHPDSRSWQRPGGGCPSARSPRRPANRVRRGPGRSRQPRTAAARGSTDRSRKTAAYECVRRCRC